MKKIYLILHFLALLLIASCAHSPIAEQPIPLAPDLLHIDSLMQSSPDSALQTLLSCHSEYEVRGTPSDINAHYQALLTSEALYKTYNPQSDIAALQSATHYFDSMASCHTDNDDVILLSARSHYMNGAIFYENDSVVEACKEYLHTLEIMQNHFDISNITSDKAKLMGLAYTRLGDLFYNNGMAQASVESFKNALDCFNMVQGYSLANTYKSLASAYSLGSNNDSALIYYRKAINLSNRQNKISVYSNSLSESAPVYYELGYTDSAFMMIRKALSLPVRDDLRLAQYFTFGSLLAKECQYDSAINYLEKSIKRNYFPTQVVSAEILMKCHQALGDTLKMQYYKNIYGEHLDKYRKTLTVEKLLANFYESYKQDRLQQDQLRNIRKRNITISAVSVFMIIVISGLIILIRKMMIDIKKKSQDCIDEKNNALAEMRRKTEAGPFVSEPICKYILETAYKQQFKSRVPCTAYIEYALSKEQLLALKDAMDRHYDNFTQWICKEYPELTNDDVDYLCLYHLGLKDTEIFALMQRAYPTIGERSRKLKRIFDSDKPLHATMKNIIARHCGDCN
ncbi:MAG: tetratricopeptide repeat protein [Bacteroidia bacterium]|nr:tetratricopeptide repeat protein [Bacteroidia bacterium]